MKKIYMFLLIGTLLLISDEILKSQPIPPCPIGFTQITANMLMIDNLDTCEYEITICVKCGVGTNPGSTIIDFIVHAIRPLDSNCQVNPDTVMNTIVRNINNPDWIFQYVTPDCTNGWPPCDGIPPIPSPIEVIYYYPICWQWDYFQINEDPPEWVTVKVAGCDCFCSWSNFFCWDSVNGLTIIGAGQTPHQTGTGCECINHEPWDPCWDEASPCSE